MRACNCLCILTLHASKQNISDSRRIIVGLILNDLKTSVSTRLLIYCLNDNVLTQNSPRVKNVYWAGAFSYDRRGKFENVKSIFKNRLSKRLHAQAACHSLNARV